MSSPNPETHGQGEMFGEDELRAQPAERHAYSCLWCGSYVLFGLGPSTDSKSRWAIAARCGGCNRKRVIATRS